MTTGNETAVVETKHERPNKFYFYLHKDLCPGHGKARGDRLKRIIQLKMHKHFEHFLNDFS